MLMHCGIRSLQHKDLSVDNALEMCVDIVVKFMHVYLFFLISISKTHMTLTVGL